MPGLELELTVIAKATFNFKLAISKLALLLLSFFELPSITIASFTNRVTLAAIAVTSAFPSSVAISFG